MNKYPYGNTYQPSYCNTHDYGAGNTTTVGSLPNCVTSAPGYAGVYDLSGNVIEWEDSCDETAGEDANCRLRGGSDLFGSDFTDSDNLTCGHSTYVRGVKGEHHRISVLLQTSREKPCAELAHHDLLR